MYYRVLSSYPHFFAKNGLGFNTFPGQKLDFFAFHNLNLFLCNGNCIMTEFSFIVYCIENFACQPILL